MAISYCAGVITVPSSNESFNTYFSYLQTTPAGGGGSSNISLNTAYGNVYPQSAVYSSGISTHLFDNGQSLYGWYVFSNSSNGTVSMSSPYSVSSAASFSMKWICSGPYSSFTISASPVYGHSFSRWALGSASGTTYSTSSTITVYYNDSNLPSYCEICAVFV